jgi:hypothetical protein
MIKPNENMANLNQIQLMQMQQNYLNNLNRMNQCPSFGPLPSMALPVSNLPLGSLSSTSSFNGFKPFSSTYQEQMNQFILNLNIILNPYPIGSMLPQMGMLTPFEVSLQAK